MSMYRQCLKNLRRNNLFYKYFSIIDCKVSIAHLFNKECSFKNVCYFLFKILTAKIQTDCFNIFIVIKN